MPVNGSTNVTADAPVTVLFDRPVVRSSVLHRFTVSPPLGRCDLERALQEADTATAPASAPCTISWNPGSDGFVLRHPDALFAPDTTYSFTLAGGFEDAGGVVNSLDHQWRIASGAAPTVTAVSPADGASAVPADAAAVVSFSTYMSAATEAAITLSPAVPGTRVAQNANDPGRFVVLPGRLLRPGTRYTLTITRAATDEHGQRLARPVTVRFRAGPIAPAGHALVLAGPPQRPADRLVLTALGALAHFEPAPAATMLEAPVCEAAQCGVVAHGQPLVAFLEADVSPDAQVVAVVEQHLDSSAGPDLHLVRLIDGTDLGVIASGAAHPAWSPDGRLLAFGAGDAVDVYARDTGRIITLPPGDPLGATPVWSGDGATLALPVTSSGGLAHVDLASPAAAARYPVPGLTGPVTDPVLSPAGDQLAVEREASGAWVVPLRGGAAPRPIGTDLQPVAFTAEGALLAVWRQPPAPPLLVAYGISTGERTELANGPPREDITTVSASGRQIAYLAPDAEGAVQAFIENADGTGPEPLTDFAVGDLQADSVTLGG